MTSFAGAAISFICQPDSARSIVAVRLLGNSTYNWMVLRALLRSAARQNRYCPDHQ
jgi:hypothetical protein